MNFYEELQPRTAVVDLGGDIVVERARLCRFMELEALARSHTPDAFLRYVALASGVPTDNLSELSFNCIHEAYRKLRDLNTLREQFPFMVRSRNRDALDYEGRELVGVIHMLARWYAWTRDYICNLYPEEAFCYVLEIIADQQREREFLYNVSSVGYDVKGRKRQFPKLPMVWPQRMPDVTQPQHIISKAKAQEIGLIPSGFTIDLAELVKKKKWRRS